VPIRSRPVFQQCLPSAGNCISVYLPSNVPCVNWWRQNMWQRRVASVRGTGDRLQSVHAAFPGGRKCSGESCNIRRIGSDRASRAGMYGVCLEDRRICRTSE